MPYLDQTSKKCFLIYSLLLVLLRLLSWNNQSKYHIFNRFTKVLSNRDWDMNYDTILHSIAQKLNRIFNLADCLESSGVHDTKINENQEQKVNCFLFVSKAMVKLKVPRNHSTKSKEPKRLIQCRSGQIGPIKPRAGQNEHRVLPGLSDAEIGPANSCYV